jgi:hypothetical protein
MEEIGCRMDDMRNVYNNSVGKMKERNYLEYQGIYCRITLKQI